MISKRHLTPEEINYILEDLPVPKYLPPRIRENVRNDITTSFRKQLSRMLIYPQILQKVKDFVHHKYQTSLSQTGEMVGILAAQTMESFTQMTLNMFHSAGLSEKNVSLGLPRFEEIMNATSNPKIIGWTFYTNKLYDTSEKLRSSVLLPEVLVESLLSRVQISDTFDEEKWYSIHDFLFSTEYKKCNWRIRLYMNPDKVFRQSLTLLQIANSIEKKLDTLYTICSPMNSVDEFIIDVFVDTRQILEIGGKNPETYVRDIVVKALKQVCVSGISGVEAVYTKQAKTGEFYFEGNGGSLINLLSHPACNSSKTINDNMWDIYDCLGIEATRSFLVSEILKVLSFDGTFVNPKHVMLLVDRMTLDGQISAVNRYGMDREHFGPLAKMAFEECTENAIKSAIHGETDDISGVNACIITGKTANIGSSSCDIMIDINSLKSIQEDGEEEVVIF